MPVSVDLDFLMSGLGSTVCSWTVMFGSGIIMFYSVVIHLNMYHVKDVECTGKHIRTTKYKSYLSMSALIKSGFVYMF